MFKFEVGEKVRVKEIDLITENEYEVGDILTVAKRDFAKGFDDYPIYWFDNDCEMGLYENELEEA